MTECFAEETLCTTSEHDRLRDERGRLMREIERLTEENDDLRKSAEIWIRMYERQLARANHVNALLARGAALFHSASIRPR